MSLKKIVSKKTVSLFLAAATCLSVNLSISRAEQSNDSILKEKQLIEEQFPNVQIQNVSNDEVDTSSAIVINSEEEYQKLLEQLSESNTNTVDTYLDLDKSTTLNARYAPGVTYSSKTASQWIGAVPGAPPVKINMSFNYQVKKVNGQWTFYSMPASKRYSWLNGVQFPVAYEWKKISHTYEPNSTKTKATFTLKGTIKTTVIYNGLPSIMTTNHTYKFNYYTSSARG